MLAGVEQPFMPPRGPNDSGSSLRNAIPVSLRSCNRGLQECLTFAILAGRERQVGKRKRTFDFSSASSLDHTFESLTRVFPSAHGDVDASQYGLREGVIGKIAAEGLCNLPRTFDIAFQ